MSHDMNSVLDHLSDRSVESVENDLIKIIARLYKEQGASPMHKITAYSYLCRKLTSDLETAIFDFNKQNMDLLYQEKMQIQNESVRVHNILGKILAAKEQELEKNMAERQELETEIKSLRRSNELIKSELEKTLRDQAQTHQLAVELRMQGLDFKAEVDRQCAKVLHSISARIGFIPSGIQQTIHDLKLMKAPGDPSYDVVRANSA